MRKIYFEVKKGNRLYFRKTKEIVRFQADGDSATAYFEDGSSQTVFIGIGDCWQRVKDTGLFCQVHRSHIVNIAFIDYLEEDCSIIMKPSLRKAADEDKTLIPVSPSGAVLLSNMSTIC